VTNANPCAQQPGECPRRPPTVGRGNAHYHEAIRLKPHFADAIRESLEAIRLKPAHADLHYNLAVMFGQKGNTVDTRRQFEEALALQPAYVAARRGLDALVLRG
jgi:tetratricopeptide (TPR) repeat protein